MKLDSTEISLDRASTSMASSLSESDVFSESSTISILEATSLMLCSMFVGL